MIMSGLLGAIFCIVLTMYTRLYREHKEEVEVTFRVGHVSHGAGVRRGLAKRRKMLYSNWGNNLGA